MVSNAENSLTRATETIGRNVTFSTILHEALDNTREIKGRNAMMQGMKTYQPSSEQKAEREKAQRQRRAHFKQ